MPPRPGGSPSTLWAPVPTAQQNPPTQVTFKIQCPSDDNEAPGKSPTRDPRTVSSSRTLFSDQMHLEPCYVNWENEAALWGWGRA